MYNPNYEFFAPTGWRCPGCGRIYSPNTNMCPYCGSNKLSYSATTAVPFWIYKEKKSTADEFTFSDSFQITTLDELLRSDFFDNNDLWEKPL